MVGAYDILYKKEVLLIVDFTTTFGNEKERVLERCPSTFKEPVEVTKVHSIEPQ